MQEDAYSLEEDIEGRFLGAEQIGWIDLDKFNGFKSIYKREESVRLGR